MQVRYIKKEEILQSMKLSSICFNYPFVNKYDTEQEYINAITQNPTESLHYNWKQQLVVHNEQNQLMACMATIPMNFQFDGNVIDGNGIGNVTTYPHHRKKGAVKAMFLKMLQDSYENNQVISYLYPFSESFYGKYGYAITENSNHYQFTTAHLKNVNETGSFELLTSQNPEIISEFKDLYAEFSAKFNLMLKRNDYDWNVIKNAQAEVNNKYAYLYKNEEGKACGYIIFENNKRIITCNELVFLNADALRSILSFIKTYQEDFDVLKLTTSSYLPLHLLVDNFHTAHCTKASICNGMVRVINVQEILKKTKYKGTGSLSICVNDKHIQQNNKLFNIEFKDNKLVDIAVQDYDETKADVVFSINAFSASIVGSYCVQDFEYNSEIKVNCASNLLEKVFYKKPCFICNYF